MIAYSIAVKFFYLKSNILKNCRINKITSNRLKWELHVL